MIPLGLNQYKNYTVWISPPLLSSESEEDILPYYEILVSKKEKNYSIYVDIVSSLDFKFIMNLDDRNQPIKDVTDLVQYQAYLDRKSSTQLLYKLSNVSVAALLAKCQELSV